MNGGHWKTSSVLRLAARSRVLGLVVREADDDRPMAGGGPLGRPTVGPAVLPASPLLEPASHYFACKTSLLKAGSEPASSRLLEIGHFIGAAFFSLRSALPDVAMGKISLDFFETAV